jgi:uroporphyrinogen decarboxylase
MRVGLERMLVAMLEDPAFVHQLFEAHAQLVMDLFDGFQKAGVEFDGVFLADDLGYKSAPLISPRHYRVLVQPYHRALCAHFAGCGLRTILHSDGQVTPLIPSFIEAGFSALHPLEAKAGLDVRDLKRSYGAQLTLIGNIDVRRLSGSRAEIEDEIASKLPLAMAGGGYIYHSDHSVPNTVSLDQYAFALDCVRRYGRYA